MHSRILVVWILLQSALFISTSGFLLTSPYDLCAYLTGITCPRYIGGTLCASNQVTYSNECEFSKAICSDRTITLVHFGPCDHERIDQDLILNVTCTDILGMNCTTYKGGNEICASDGQNYLNDCHFEKARCFYRDLYLRHYGACIH
ncbi:hypothetical protein DPMN_010639 [Dreissena polymorpha]|uniref:Kazal-like domain-containing protein n=2 Tax=Dreissena polymorpha TaxID=45954 RepID=A0A9D4N2E5_DREPO|nr:hypothetical protein DPMN_010639 [Dreissena polymorpha]